MSVSHKIFGLIQFLAMHVQIYICMLSTKPGRRPGEHTKPWWDPGECTEPGRELRVHPKPRWCPVRTCTRPWRRPRVPKKPQVAPSAHEAQIRYVRIHVQYPGEIVITSHKGMVVLPTDSNHCIVLVMGLWSWLKQCTWVLFVHKPMSYWWWQSLTVSVHI